MQQTGQQAQPQLCIGTPPYHHCAPRYLLSVIQYYLTYSFSINQSCRSFPFTHPRLNSKFPNLQPWRLPHCRNGIHIRPSFIYFHRLPPCFPLLAGLSSPVRPKSSTFPTRTLGNVQPMLNAQVMLILSAVSRRPLSLTLWSGTQNDKCV